MCGVPPISSQGPHQLHLLLLLLLLEHQPLSLAHGSVSR
jgi:hypothetical protein